MKTAFGICQRKKRFQTEEEALAVAARADTPLRPYRCALCRRYHLTSRTKGMRVPAFERERRARGRQSSAQRTGPA